jgi:Flp pilus assembly secretin CpaC
MRKSPNGTPRRAALTLAALLFAGGTSQPAAAQQRVAAGPKVIAAGSGDPVAPSYRATSTRETVAVTIDHAKVIRLPQGSQTIIIGNPIIADVTVQKNGLVVLTGKSYGVTNMIALDAGGAMLAESLISVQAPTESLVTVQRGLDRESYSCTPNCQPSILLGDATKYFSEAGGQAGARNSLAAPR